MSQNAHVFSNSDKSRKDSMFESLIAHFTQHTTLGKQIRADPDLRAAVLSFFPTFLFSLLVCTLSSSLDFSFCIAIFVSFAISLYKGKQYGFNFLISLQATLLGMVCGICFVLFLCLPPSPFALFCRYVFTLSVFHYTEFLFTAICNRRCLKVDSFLLNHSRAYWLAAVGSWIEFAVEVWLFADIKMESISWIGLGLAITGEIIRKTAMVHAGMGFTHQLAMTKKPDHRLVTTGIYEYIRHPGYSGWLLWSISTQIILCNPVCLVVYAIVSWKFFNERIYDEERDLIQFFGQQYIDYRRDVWSGVPFVTGYDIEVD